MPGEPVVGGLLTLSTVRFGRRTSTVPSAALARQLFASSPSVTFLRSSAQAITRKAAPGGIVAGTVTETVVGGVVAPPPARPDTTWVPIRSLSPVLRTGSVDR